MQSDRAISAGERLLARTQTSPALILRERLLARLDTAARVTVVRGPVGFGKSTLITQWLTRRSQAAQSRREVTGVLRLTSDCTTGVQFWPSAWHALREAGLPDRPELAQALPSHRLRSALQAVDVPVVLVLDGFERLTDVDVERDLRDVLGDCPALRLILGVRGSRFFRQDRQPERATVEVSGADLTFTAPEIAQLLTLVGVSAGQERAAGIHAETGGWPELTHLVVHALGARGADGDVDDAAVAAAVAHDYLRARALPAIGNQAQLDALLASSVVDRFSAPLLDALRSGPSTGWPLEGLVQAGLLSAADRGSPGYRWPPAVRRGLAEELRNARPARLAELHSRVAQWYFEQGQPGPALEHAVAAEHWQLAVDIIDGSWRYLFRHHLEELYRAFNRIPLTAIARSPRVLAVRDMGLEAPDDLLFSAIPELPDDPEKLAALGSGAGVFDLLDTLNVLIVCLRHRGLHARCLALSDKLDVVLQAVRRHFTPQVVQAGASTTMQMAISRLFGDDLPGARKSFQDAYNFSGLDAGDEYVRRDSAGKLALTHALAGDARQAIHWLARHQSARLTVTGEWFNYTVASTARCARLLVALEQLDVAAAAAAVEVDGPIEADEFWAYFAYADALYLLHAGDAAAGLRTLYQHARPSSGHADAGPAAAALLAAIEADLLMALGRGNEAHAVLTGAYAEHPGLQVGRARLALLRGRADEAAAIAQDLRWERQAVPRWQQEMLLLRAVAHQRLGQHEAAAETLRRALATAAALAAWRAFATVPRADLTAIAVSLSASEREQLDRIHLLPETYPATVELIELTRQEVTILRHLAEGLSRAELGQRLFISKNTVKFHVRGLYRKLGATSREQALARARALGLLASA